jgi:hypothetical protein
MDLTAGAGRVQEGQVERGKKEGGAGGEAGEDADRVPRPRLADGYVRGDDERQRDQDDERLGRVERQGRGQPDLLPGGVSPGEGLPSPRAGVIASRIGRNSSIGIGSTIVVFFS